MALSVIGTGIMSAAPDVLPHDVSHYMENTSMKILVVDDHPLFRAGLVQVIQNLTSQTQVLQASGVEQAQALLECMDVRDLDLVLLDLNLNGVHGLDGLVVFRQRYPTTPVVLVSGTPHLDLVREGRSKGAQGFIRKNTEPEELRKTITRVLDGELCFEDLSAPTPQKQLSARQREVLSAIAQGRTNKEIARDLGISIHTVRTHIVRLFWLLAVKTRTEAVTLARREGLL